jgi:Bacterial lectin
MNTCRVRQICLVLVCGLLGSAGQRAQAQNIAIPSNGWTATNVCASTDVTTLCQVATNGSAAVAMVPSGDSTVSVLRLTPAIGGQTGSAWFVTQQPFAIGFDTTFQFQLNGGSGADGIAFVIQNAASGLQAIGYTGGNGGALGYGDDDADSLPNSGIPASVAFEFDTYMNSWDPNSNHVAIQSCGPNPNTSHHNENCPSLPSFGNSTIGLAASNITLTGGPHLAEIKYVAPAMGCPAAGEVCSPNLTISIDGQLVLSASVNLTTYLGSGPAFVGFTGATGGSTNNQDIQNWTYTATQPAPPQPTGAGTTNTFTFVPAGNGTEVQHTLAFPSDAVIPQGIDPNTLQLFSFNNVISDSATLPEYVVGSPFGPAHCFIKPGDNQLSGLTDACSLYGDVCADATHAPSDANCPTAAPNSSNLIKITDTWDSSANQVPIATGTTAGLIHFFPNFGESWLPFGSIPEAPGAVNPVCTDATTTSGNAGPNHCDIVDVENFALSGDPTTSGGTKRKGMFISVYGVPMLETTVSANNVVLNTPGVQGPPSMSWFKTGTLNLNFLVNPAQAPPPPNNNFVAAPVNELTYGLTDLSGTNTIIPDTTFLASDLTHPAPVNFPATTPALADGKYLLHWYSLDNVHIKEQNIQLLAAVGSTCPDGSPVVAGKSCYVTSLFNAEINIDQTPPTISLITPPGPQPTFPSATYPANSNVYANYSCSDSGSGLASCVGTVPSGSKIDTMPAGIRTPKTFTVNASDIAGNNASTSATYYVSCHYVQFGVSPSTVSRGSWVTVTGAVMDCQSSSQKLTIELSLSGPLGRNCANLTLPMFSFPLTVPAGTSKSFSIPVLIPKCQCGGTFTLTTTTLVNKVQVDQTSTSLTVK